MKAARLFAATIILAVPLKEEIVVANVRSSLSKIFATQMILRQPSVASQDENDDQKIHRMKLNIRRIVPLALRCRFVLYSSIHRT